MKARDLSVRLPVVLGADAKRQVMIATGLAPDVRQVFEVRSLAAVDRASRARLVWVCEKTGLLDRDRQGRVDYYADFIDLNGRWHVHRNGEFLSPDQSYIPLDGRTTTAFDILLANDRTGRVQSALTWAPLVDAVDDDGEIELATVLDAYEEALTLADRVVDLCAGTRAGGRSPECISIEPDLVEVVPTTEGLHPLGLLRESDPEAFSDAVTLLNRARELPDPEWFANEACRRTDSSLDPFSLVESDRDAVREMQNALDKAVARSRSELERESDQAAYEAERSAWIARHGSRRLKTAAERGYKHDGLYREERLALELPGFLPTIGKHSKVGEVLNPSQDGLDLEDEVSGQLHAAGLKVTAKRLVWVSTDRNLQLPDGEFVQVRGYLGRHDVYRPVNPEEIDDIPF